MLVNSRPYLTRLNIEKHEMIIQPIVNVITDHVSYKTFELRFVTRQQAETYLQQIGSPSWGIHTSNSNHYYYLTISFQDIINHRKQLRTRISITKPTSRFIIKSLRTDEKGFVRDFIKSITGGEKKPLRVVAKKTYTVTAKGIFKRKSPNEHTDEDRKKKTTPLKTPQYTKAQKQGFSKAQSASLGTRDYHPQVFGFNADQRNAVLPAILFDCKDALFTDRNSLRDWHTVARPYDADSYNVAKEIYKSLLEKNEGQRTLFAADEIDAFIKALKDPKNPWQYNEILVRLRFGSAKTTKLAIASDTLPCRLQTIEYARLLQTALQEEKQDETLSCLYYLPSDPQLHFGHYAKEEQTLDQLQGRMIYADQEVRHRHYHEQSFQFLLALSPDEIRIALHNTYYHTSAFWLILNTGVQLMESLTELAGYSLEQAINDSFNRTVQFNNAALFYLVKAGYGKAVAEYITNYSGKIELEEVAPLNPMENAPGTLASLAVTNNELGVIRALKARDVALKSRAPLAYIAAKLGLLDMFKLVYSFNDEYHTGWQYSPLLQAAENNQLAIVKCIVESKSELTLVKDAIVHATNHRCVETLQYLIDYAKLPPDPQDILMASYIPLGIALCNAVSSGDRQITKILLDAGFNANGMKNAGAPLISDAVGSGYFKILALLLSYGANINARNSDGYPALHVAMNFRDIPMVKFLVDHGADVTEAELRHASYQHYNALYKLIEKIIKNDPRLTAMDTRLTFTLRALTKTPDIQPISSSILSYAELKRDEPHTPELLDSKEEIDISRHAAILHLRTTLRKTPRYDNDKVNTLLKLAEAFFQLDQTCVAFSASANQTAAKHPTAAQNFKHEIAHAYNQVTEFPLEIKRIHADLVKRAELFNNEIKSKLKSVKVQPTTYVSFLSLWKRDKVLAKEIQANISKLLPPNPQ